jgi:hypothetical protein
MLLRETTNRSGLNAAIALAFGWKADSFVIGATGSSGDPAAEAYEPTHTAQPPPRPR